MTPRSSIGLEQNFLFDNTEFSTRISALGNGYNTAHKCLLTSRRSPVSDGTFFYLRDLSEPNHIWSATLRPTSTLPAQYTLRSNQSSIIFIRHEHAIETELSVGLPHHGPWEMRRLIITNHAPEARTLEVTSSIDVTLLFDQFRDIDHQTFSNLFVGTTFDADHHALLFHRRSHTRPENFPIFSHQVCSDTDTFTFVGFDTARQTFLGRGHGFDQPASLTSKPSNTQGYTLDPIASLRTRITLDSKQSSTLYFIQAAHFLPDTPDHLLESCSHPETVTRLAEEIFSNKTPHKTIESSFSHADLKTYFHGSRQLPTTNQTTDIDFFDTSHLLFWNGYGGFDPDTSDYHIFFHPLKGLPPQPWSNILCNRRFGTLVTENSIGGSWHQDSRQNRLTPWNNDPVIDTPSEILYLYSHQENTVWSATPAPFLNMPFHITHGRGFTSYAAHRGTLHQTLTLFSDPEKSIRYSLLKIRNDGPSDHTLSLVHFLDYTSPDTSNQRGEKINSLEFDPERNGLCFPLPQSDHPDTLKPSGCASLASSLTLCGAAGNKQTVFGPLRSTQTPHLPLQAIHLEIPADPNLRCATIQTDAFTLQPGETKTIVTTLATATSHDELSELIKPSLSENDRIAIAEDVLATISHFWNTTLGMPQIVTPDDSINILFNHWVPYQILASRMWSRTAFYQSSGAFGYRDQLQDALALLHIDPKMTRDHIIHCAGQQYEDGNTRWWWFPESNLGIRSRSSDNPLWLSFVTALYVRFTGDTSIWDATMPYLRSENCPTEEITIGQPTDHHEPLWHHCLKALEYTLAFGPHGLPLIREGDWNDGMNTVGQKGQGESIWLGFFIVRVLNEYLPLLEARNETLTVLRYKTIRKNLIHALDHYGWDGEWYRRAYYDDGTPLGSSQNREGKIDAIAQSWAIISGVAPTHKGIRAMQSLLKHLYDDKHHLLKLLAPPFDTDHHTPGYIKDYPPGIRENGSQYNHAALWAAEAFAELGDTDNMWQMLQTINAIDRSSSPRKIERYRTEPYVIAADIYTLEPHLGMGGWTWYTASAGLFYHIIIERLFGLKQEGNQLAVHSCLPTNWRSAEITLHHLSATYHIRFTATTEKHHNHIRHIIIDGKTLHKNIIPLKDDGQLHECVVTLK